MSALSSDAALIGQFYAERNREYPLQVGVMSVGRGSANALRIRDDRVAAYHIRIERAGSRHVMEVMAEDAPTTLNGARLRPGDRRTLSKGDVIGLSDLSFRFTDGNADAALSPLVLSEVSTPERSFGSIHPRLASGVRPTTTSSSPIGRYPGTTA